MIITGLGVASILKDTASRKLSRKILLLEILFSAAYFCVDIHSFQVNKPISSSYEPSESTLVE